MNKLDKKWTVRFIIIAIFVVMVSVAAYGSFIGNMTPAELTDIIWKICVMAMIFEYSWFTDDRLEEIEKRLHK